MQRINMQSLIKKTFLLVFVIVLCILLGSCGESVSYSAAPPSNVISPSYADPSQNLFRFTTAEDLNTTGTVVYYKIYTDESKLHQDLTAIMSKGTDSNYGPRITWMTEQLKYKKMNGEDILIQATNSNRNVEIRLSDETSFTAAIVVAGTQTGIPERFNHQNFNFSNTYYPQSETDFEGTQTSAGPWYVAAFAFSIISENGVSSPQQGPLKYLGCVRISY